MQCSTRDNGRREMNDLPNFKVEVGREKEVNELQLILVFWFLDIHS